MRRPAPDGPCRRSDPGKGPHGGDLAQLVLIVGESILEGRHGGRTDSSQRIGRDLGNGRRLMGQRRETADQGGNSLLSLAALRPARINHFKRGGCCLVRKGWHVLATVTELIDGHGPTRPL